MHPSLQGLFLLLANGFGGPSNTLEWGVAAQFPTEETYTKIY